MSYQEINTDDAREITAIDKRVAELNVEREQLLQRKQIILNRPKSHQTRANLSTDQKVSIFKNLFRGRTDIFATRWQNSQGRSGYSVACSNEWVKKVCEKPRIKCNVCPNRKYEKLNDQIIYDHLAGKQVVGLYPLLTDNTCYLLAADFDKIDWQEAIRAMSQACLHFKIPHAIEISRSGNGAHLWIFFSELVQARNARLLGFGLLDKAMEIHPDLSFDSYDRLFPNQDIMPEGGFGNLIALPLQHQARQQGNSLFVDLDLLPYADQWSFLDHLNTVSLKQLNDLLVVFTPNTLTDSEHIATDTRPPWEQGAKIKAKKIDNCPEQITLILANHIYLKLDEIPAPLAARLKRLASFSNPVFFKTQALRFSTHGIPRYISCARIEQGYLSLPRGCFDETRALLEEQNMTRVSYTHPPHSEKRLSQLASSQNGKPTH